MTSAVAPLQILVVDDEPAILRFLQTGLSGHGFKVLTAGTGKAALDLLEREKINLVVLDLGLPDMEGLDIISRLRAAQIMVPIIVLSSRNEERTKVEALELGADDYLAKPFGMDELIARVRVAQRHQFMSRGEQPVFRVGDLTVDLVRRLVTVRGEVVHLSPREYELLRLLVRHAGKVLTRDLIMREIWRGDSNVQYLRIYIRLLRQKIELHPERPYYILTEIGVGYRLRASDQER
ncbi:MAG: response regulator transcription factor [Acetobacteraceae bacterium]